MEATSGVRVRLRDGASPIAKTNNSLVRKVSDEQPVDEPSQDPFGDRTDNQVTDNQVTDNQVTDNQMTDNADHSAESRRGDAYPSDSIQPGSRRSVLRSPGSSTAVSNAAVSGDIVSGDTVSGDNVSGDTGSGSPSFDGPALNGPARSRTGSSRAVPNRAVSNRVGSNLPVSSRAVSSRAVSSRAVPQETQESPSTFAQAERGRGVVSEAYADTTNASEVIEEPASEDANGANEAASVANSDSVGEIAEDQPIREPFGDEVAQEQTADEQAADGQIADGQISDEQAADGQVADGQVADQASDGPFMDPVNEDGQLGDGTVAAAGEVSRLTRAGSVRLADRDGEGEGEGEGDRAGDNQAAVDGQAYGSGQIAEDDASHAVVDGGADAEPEVLEQGVPFAEGDMESVEVPRTAATAEDAAAPAPVLVANRDRTVSRNLKVLPTTRATDVRSTPVATTSGNAAKSVIAVSAVAGLPRRVLPMGPPSTIPHRSLPALPPRKVEAQPDKNMAVTATSSPTGTAANGAAGSTVAAVSTAGNVALTAAQPNGAGLNPAGGELGETPLRNAAFCRRLYNERNCCSDENACNDHRAHVKSHPLSKISLDITPTCNLTSRQEGNQANCGFPFEQSPSRVWRDRKGVEVARGRVTGFAHLRVEVTDDKGNATRIRLRDLNEDDICFLSAWCGVPSECRLDDVALAARNWTPITMTWKASALCHKPLYFQDEQLERYGHTTGPIFQPVVSGAHFFANIALLPYNMGIHPMSECQYALGYYRPGSCAPWMIPPFPLSARGALAETGVILGGFYLIP
ncbi:MAG: hypothetical protein RLY70_4037 [Planctomycetota bacterium]